MALCLEGLKVLDLTRYAPGPFCTLFLADLGADVLKVEEPGEPEGRRAQQGRGARNPADQLKAWPSNPLHRNKRSIAINFRAEQGRHIFYRLVKTADVVVEEFRPGVTKRLGIDYDTLKETNPGIIYCAITGYGQTGPYRDLPGHDINYISSAGVLGMIGQRGGSPAIPYNFIGDFAGGGLTGAIGILAALYAREKTGMGQFVDISMTDGALSLLALALWSYFSTGQVPARGDTPISGSMPQYNVYETKDAKYVSLGCIEPWFYANLCRALGREDFIPYADDQGEKRQEIFDYFREVFRTKTRDEWFELLRQHDTCVSKVLALDELVSDPQVAARQMIVGIDHPTLGKVSQIGIPIKMSQTPGAVRALSPDKGQHTDAVLREAGYSQDEIEEFRRNGAVG